MRAEMRALRLADAVVTVDTRLYRHALRLVPERSSSVYTLMNFIDTSTFAPVEDVNEEERERRGFRTRWDVPQDKVVLFCPRRLVKKNGVMFPSLALAAMKPRDAERFVLLHAGEGGEQDEIERIVRTSHLEGTIRLLGGQDRDAILELYRLADIVLVPSVHSENVEEATSLSALEAMASGRPLIAGNVGGLAEMVTDGTNGLLVPADAEALAAAILRLASDPALGRRMAEAARTYVVANHSHLSAAESYAEVYRLAGGGAACRCREIVGRAERADGPSPDALDETASERVDSVLGGAQPMKTPEPAWPVISLLGFPLDLVTREQAARWIMDAAGGRRSSRGDARDSCSGTCAETVEPIALWRTRIATSFNPELVIRAHDDQAAAEALLLADLRYPDGVGAVWAASRQGGRIHGADGPRCLALPDRVPGIELADRVCALAAESNVSLFFLGAAEGVAREAARRQALRFPGLRVVGNHHGFFGPAEEDEVVREIRASGADILLVAMGAPRQEVFLARHRFELGVGVALGLGGSFDVWAGLVKRAPQWIREAKLEWLYRLASNPRRIRRQAVLPRFAAEVLRWSPDDYGPPRRGRAGVGGKTEVGGSS